MKVRANALRNKIIALFKQGLTPKELTQSIIISLMMSLIPILGISTFVLTTLSLRSKLNLPIMIALSYLMWPIQILLIIPFIRVGEFVFSVHTKNHSLEEIITSFQTSFFKTLSHLSFELLCGFGGWLFTAVPIALGTYFVSIAVLKTVIKKNNN
jgi:uncharacterized protein (DUF2062 family)